MNGEENLVTSIIRELEAKGQFFPVFATKYLKLENTILYELIMHRQPLMSNQNSKFIEVNL